MKTWAVPILLLVVVLAVAGYLGMQPDAPVNDAPITGLPWQIEPLPDGYTRVFGITPGVTTLRAAVQQLGDDMDLAIIAAPDEAGSLEPYYGHYSAGPVTGRLILVLDVPPGQLDEWRGRSQGDSGTRRYLLHPDDLALAWQLPVRGITFSPSLDLDADIIQSRFGTPESVVEINTQQAHWLYPDRGLDVVLDAKGKEVLQYLAPREFAAYRAGLQ